MGKPSKLSQVSKPTSSKMPRAHLPSVGSQKMVASKSVKTLNNSKEVRKEKILKKILKETTHSKHQ